MSAGAGRVILAMMAWALLAGGAGCGDDGRGGPLRTNGGDRLANGVFAREPFSYGQAVVYNDSADPLTLKSVVLVDATPGLKLLDSYALGPRRHFGRRRLESYSGDHGWPTAYFDRVRPLRPLDGHAVPPFESRGGSWGVELYLKLRVPRLGKFRFRRLEVTYEVDGEEYRKVLDHAFTACAIKDPRHGGCGDD